MAAVHRNHWEVTPQMNAPLTTNTLFSAREYRRFYVSVRWKFALALFVAIAWTALSVRLASAWMSDLAALTNAFFAVWTLTFVAFVPGFMNAFLATSLLLDKRPPRRTPLTYPGVSLLIAAYNEEAGIEATLESIARLNYLGAVDAIVLNDGSRDKTVERAREAIAGLALPYNITIRLLDFDQNRGKSAVLNDGLSAARHDLVCTIDGDSRLRSDSLKEIVERFLSDPPGTVAVAGSVLVRNSRASLVTAAQEWDYFHGISAVKRMQSMYHGTLVAQGAFSLYRKDAVQAAGGWPETVGEDIVLTWAMLENGHRVGYAEDAIVFTDAPPTFRQFYQQRKRWSRGLIEAFQRHSGLLLKRRLVTLFVWWNLLFLPLDLTFTFIFIPGLVAGLLGYYWIAGPLTLLLLPLAMVWNGVIFIIQRRMFQTKGLKVRRNVSGLLFYMLIYAVVMQPVCLWGYISELTGQRKKWGTK
jgi:biofilm PGA synthesis N-glycosyltransferase PgaC